jgi:hypothetical protein
VVLLEHDVYNPAGIRLERFYDARGTQSCGVPWVMVDSGYTFACGAMDFATVYRAMIDDALTRPPEADIQGSYERITDDVRVHVRLTNHTGRMLSFANWTTVNALVWEDAKVGRTSRFVRGGSQVDLPDNFADGATMNVDVLVANVPVADWAKAHVLVIADYRPEPTESRYVSLQAAELQPLVPNTPVPLPTFPPGSPRILLPVSLNH